MNEQQANQRSCGLAAIKSVGLFFDTGWKQILIKKRVLFRFIANVVYFNTGLPSPVCVVYCASPMAVSVSKTSLAEGDI